MNTRRFFRLAPAVLIALALISAGALRAIACNPDAGSPGHPRA